MVSRACRRGQLRNPAKTLRHIGAAYLRVGAYALNAAASEVLLEQVVEKRRWIAVDEFGRLMSLATLIPGPYHVNLVILTGYALGGFYAGLVAVAAFILPGFMLAWIAANVLSLEVVQRWLQDHAGITTCMLAAASGLVLCIIVKLGQRTLPGRAHWALVFALAALLWTFRLPFALAIVGGGAVGLVIAVWKRRRQ